MGSRWVVLYFSFLCSVLVLTFCTHSQAVAQLTLANFFGKNEKKKCLCTGQVGYQPACICVVLIAIFLCYPCLSLICQYFSLHKLIFKFSKVAANTLQISEVAPIYIHYFLFTYHLNWVWEQGHCLEKQDIKVFCQP